MSRESSEEPSADQIARAPNMTEMEVGIPSDREVLLARAGGDPVTLPSLMDKETVAGHGRKALPLLIGLTRTSEGASM